MKPKHIFNSSPLAVEVSDRTKHVRFRVKMTRREGNYSGFRKFFNSGATWREIEILAGEFGFTKSTPKKS